MSIPSKLVFGDFSKQVLNVDQHRKNYEQARQKEALLTDVRYEIHTTLKEKKQINWENHPNRLLLDRLYNEEGFQDLLPVYKFANPQKMQPLLERIEHQFEKSRQDLQQKQHLFQQKQSTLLQLHSELLKVISTLGYCLSQAMK